MSKLYLLGIFIWIFLALNIQKTKVIRVYETFAGIGAQHKALSKLDKGKKYFKVVQTSEWDTRAIVAYSQIHHKKEFDKKLIAVQKWSESTINKYILNRTFSLNSKTPGHVIRKDLNFKQNLIAANEVNNNYPDITRVSGKQLKDIDLLTYSFPCQGLSIANMGRGQGIKEDAKSTSNLIWQIRRILLEASQEKISLPKYLIMENVKNLIGPKHKKDYEAWLEFLKSMNYTTKTMVLNGLDHGSLQKRERVFAISILNWSNYMTDDEFQKLFESKFKKKLSKEERKVKYIGILTTSNVHQDEIFDATPKNTPSRIKMATENRDLLSSNDFIFRTLTTKQDRHPNIGMINVKSKVGYLNKRFVTNREAYQIMGFDNDDFSRVKEKYKEGIITKESLYRQAGNSIVVNVIQDVFKFIKEFEFGGKHE